MQRVPKLRVRDEPAPFAATRRNSAELDLKLLSQHQLCFKKDEVNLITLIEVKLAICNSIKPF